MWELHPAQGFYVGDIGRFSVGGDFFQNYMIVSGNVDSMNIKGDFDDSTLILNSRSADLKSLIVGGNISGTIISYGHIGTIMSQKGGISADVTTMAGGSDNDVDLIQTANGFTGDLIVGGDLKKFISKASLGTNPENSLTGRSQTFNIAGNLDYLAVIGTVGQTHLYANINVGGDFGTLDVDGTLYSDVTVNGSLKKLVLDGGLGGLLDMDGNGIPETAFGSLNIFGAIGSMKFNPNADIYADLSLGGSIASLTLRNADIHGNITSRYGTIGTISVTGGDITSIISAKYIGSVSVTNGQISGTVRAGTGIGSLSAGAIDGAMISSGWNIGNVTVKGNVNNSFILAGYDAGANGIVDGIDDNPITGGVHSGNINSLNVGGGMNRTIVAGGVGPRRHFGQCL